MSASSPPSAQDTAAALVVAYKSRHGGAEPPRMAVVLPLAQAIGPEGSLSRYFLGTNNLGAMHATSRFATAHAGDTGYGMVAFLDHSPGGVPYIARMAVYPTLSNGAFALLALVEKMVSLDAVSSSSDYSTALYAHGYFEGMHAPATPIAARVGAAASGTWTDADRANISDYAAAIDAHVGQASAAYDALSSYTGDPSLVNSGPPFAPLADRLTPSPAYAPHTLPHARELLGSAASSPPPGGVSLDDALATPDGDGVWLFGQGAPSVSSAKPTATWPFVLAGAALAAAAVGAAVAPKPWIAWITQGLGT